MNKFHQFDPWDILAEIQQTQMNQQQSIATIATAHNVTQSTVDKLLLSNQYQRQQIKLLQQQIAELSLNTKSRNMNNG